jgi:MFS family permease
MSLLVAYSKKSEREQNIGLIEMAGGLGLLGGPLFGATMFAVGGYAAPFSLMAIIYIVMMPIVYTAL